MMVWSELRKWVFSLAGRSAELNPGIPTYTHQQMTLFIQELFPLGGAGFPVGHWTLPLPGLTAGPLRKPC